MKKTLLLVATAVMACVSAFGQWNSNPAENLLAWPDDKSFYYEEMGMTPDGGVWIAVNHPMNGSICTSLQLVDSLGNLKFEEPLLVSDYQTRSWTSCGQILFVDRDGNAIVSVNDFRYNDGPGENENHSVYKISPEGEFLWGEDGITLEGEEVHDLVAAMNICQLSDGSYVFAWMHNRDNGDYNMMTIEMQRVSPDGEMLWNAEDVRLYDEKISYLYPYVVDGGNNQVILLYAKGSGQELLARKLDFDGTPVWSKDTRVYNAGFGSIPIWTILDVHPSGDGGLIVSWNDDRYYTNVESVYMAYVKPNGELGFTSENGQILGLMGWRSLHARCQYDKASDAFYAIWEECSSGQSWNRLVAQKISKEGELLWGEEALELKPMEQTDYGYFSIQNGPENEVAFFYMQNYSGSFGDVEAFVTTVNYNDTTIRRQSEFTKSDRVSEKTSLVSTPMYDGKYWIVMFEDNGVFGEEEKIDRIKLQRINADFTLGNPNADQAVEGVRAENATFAALATLVDGEAMFVANMNAATQATLAIYDINGALVATPFDGVLAAGKQYIEWNANVPAGIYLATLTTANGVETVKILVK